jgi:hypothetical protein
MASNAGNNASIEIATIDINSATSKVNSPVEMRVFGAWVE